MKCTILTLITFLAVTATRAADIITTFHSNPTLSREANPVVTVFGAGPVELLIVNVLAAVIFIYLPLLCFWLGRRPCFEQHPADAWEFVSLAFYRRLMPRSKLLCALLMFWPLPKDWVQVCRAWSVVISWATVFATLVAVASWSALKFHWYHTLYGAVSFHYYSFLPLLAALIGCIVGWKLFLKSEFHEKGQTGGGTR